MRRKHYYCNNTHLTLNQRKIIETGIENRSTKAAIAKTIGKDPTTVAKEIRNHRTLKARNIQIYPIDCKNIKTCRNSCRTKCDNYQKMTCKYRDRSPGACNKCVKANTCMIDKYYYDAEKAHKQYRFDLVDSRQGFNLTTSSRDRIADILVPLINQGQSVYQILSSHPEIGLSERTIYTYIDQGVFHDYGLINLSLKRKVQRKQFKDKYKPRKEPVNYEGHRYLDYLDFIKQNPDTKAVQMDTLYNNQEGPYIQTLMFTSTSLMIGYIHNERTCDCMSDTFDMLEDILGHDTFIKLIPLVLTDRGPEFSKPHLFEFNKKTGEARTNIYYCDPMQSTQKAHVENNHIYVREILPKNINLSGITNKDLSLAFSHINSTPRQSLGGKSPYELFSFIYGHEVLDLLNISFISRDDVILKPYLISTK